MTNLSKVTQLISSRVQIQTAVCRIMAPKEIHDLIPCNREYVTLLWQKGLWRCDYIKDLEIKRLFWMIWVGPMQSWKSLWKTEGWGERVRGDLMKQRSEWRYVAGFQDGRGPWTKESGQPLEVGKIKKTDTPQEPPKGTKPADTSSLPQWDPFQTSNLEN